MPHPKGPTSGSWNRVLCKALLGKILTQPRSRSDRRACEFTSSHQALPRGVALPLAYPTISSRRKGPEHPESLAGHLLNYLCICGWLDESRDSSAPLPTRGQDLTAPPSITLASVYHHSDLTPQIWPHFPPLPTLPLSSSLNTTPLYSGSFLQCALIFLPYSEPGRAPNISPPSALPRAAVYFPTSHTLGQQSVLPASGCWSRTISSLLSVRSCHPSDIHTVPLPPRSRHIHSIGQSRSSRPPSQPPCSSGITLSDDTHAADASTTTTFSPTSAPTPAPRHHQ